MIKSSDPGLADRFIVLALHKVSRWERVLKKYDFFRENDDIERDFEGEREGAGDIIVPRSRSGERCGGRTASGSERRLVERCNSPADAPNAFSPMKLNSCSQRNRKST